MDRSVSADLTLEAGEYCVVMKIRAEYSAFSSVQEVVRSNVNLRLSKLMQIGLSYDMAHAKVRDEDKLEERRAKKRVERARLNRLKKKLKEQLMKSKKRKKHVENKEKRKKRAAKAKKLVKAKTKAAKQAEEKAQSATITGQLDAASQTSEIVSSTDADVKDPAPAAQPMAKSNSLASPTPSNPPTTMPKPTSTPSASEDEEDGNDSDLDSVVSEISSGTVEEEIEALKKQLAAKPKLPPPGNSPVEEDGIEPGYWNAVVVVGLRVYSKESGVSIKVVRPHDLVVKKKFTIDEMLAEEVAKLEETATGALLLIDDENEGGVVGAESDMEGVMGSLYDY